jgi:holo-[acyl-carrier protein] synthase
MGVRTGIDIVEIDRIRNAVDSAGDSFIRRVFTEKEIAYCESKKKAGIMSYAARFSAKEAVSKALGTGIATGVSFQDIEIVNDEYGKPHVFLHGEAEKRYGSIGGKTLDISLTHSRDYAAAFVVIET